MDDDAELCALLGEFLEREGFAVEFAHDGPAGLEKAVSGAADLVVLDVMLPGWDGFEILRRLRPRSPVPVIMLTARGEDVDRIVGLELGADDYLPKPFHFPELVLRIRALARRQPAARPRIYRAAGIELDTLRHAAARDGRQLSLSAREFAVLEALMRAHPAVLSAEDLLEQAWDEHTDPFSNIVSVTISRLRRKLGEPAVIGTIPHVGYHLMDPAA